MELEYASISDRKIRGQLRNPSDIEKTVRHFSGLAQYISCPFQKGPGWQGAAQGLSTVHIFNWVFLGFGESNNGQELGSPYLQLVCRRTLPLLAGTVCDHKDNKI